MIDREKESDLATDYLLLTSQVRIDSGIVDLVSNELMDASFDRQTERDYHIRITMKADQKQIQTNERLQSYRQTEEYY